MTTTGGTQVGRLGLGAALALGLALGACTEVDTTPSRLAPYYGEWTAPNVSLKLEPGKMVYRNRQGFPKSAYIQSPLRGLSGNDIIYGGQRRGRLRVDVPPHPGGDGWKMTVGGTELQRR